FRFADLPTELALLVFVFAAQPTFTETDTYNARNPYSPALLLCSVSRIVRRTVLPSILHTVLLSESRHVMAFVDALYMQKAYAEQQHHLCLDYASSVHRIWMGEFLGPPRVPNAPFISSFTPYGSEPELDVSLLAPVLLAAPSLALDFASLDVLLCCIKYTLDSDVDLKVDHERSPSPWSTKNLTLSGCVSRRWRPFTETVHGYAFLSSISHLTSL
ncbi:hypothetical protein DEU56DRAFT_701339, partial [Suillus clintonianus]|uniref:uncharacterized protein n=1 Tax=Suillus clintonianus TaxID=1904413 RepID=UPI001B87D2CB